MTPTGAAHRRFRITIRLSEAERVSLDAAAQSACITLSAHVRRVLVHAKPEIMARRPSVETTLLARALGQLGKIGSNLNQIARAVNRTAQGLALAPFLERELLRSLSELRTSRRLLLDALGRRSPAP